MAKGSANLFPYMHLVPAAAPAAPAAGAERIYLDSADGNKLKRKNSAGTVTAIEGASSTPALVGARAYRSAALSLTSGVVTTIPLDAESFDSGSLHDNVTNPSRITVPTTGKYLVTGAISYAGSATGAAQVRFLVNGATIARLKVVDNDVQGVDPDITDILSLTSGDYVELVGWQSSGAANALNVGSISVFLAVSLLGT